MIIINFDYAAIVIFTFLALKLVTKVCKGLFFEFIGAKEVKFKVASLIKFELEVIIHKANPKTNLL